MERANTVTLPALSIDWWDINDHSWKQATLSAETVTVQSGTELPKWVSERNYYRWALLLLSLMVLGLALFSAVLWRNRLPNKASDAMQNVRSTPTISEKAAWSQLRRSLKQQQPARVRKDLLVWARVRWPTLGITQLDQLERIDGELASTAVKLNDSLYAKEPKIDTDYGAITKVLLRLRKGEIQIAGQVANGVQKTLYPNQ